MQLKLFSLYMAYDPKFSTPAVPKIIHICTLEFMRWGIGDISRVCRFRLKLDKLADKVGNIHTFTRLILTLHYFGGEGHYVLMQKKYNIEDVQVV